MQRPISMNVSLTTTLEAYVRRKVATGLYNNASEVVREALRLMLEREAGGQPARGKSEVVAALKALEPVRAGRYLSCPIRVHGAGASAA
jgi:antitoxin ParD1/3/4